MIDELLVSFFTEGGWGIDVPSKQNSLIISPNPSTGMVHFSSGLVELPDISKLELINIEGRTVEEFHSRNSSTLDISAHPDGVYFLKAWTDEGFSTSKVVLQR